VRQGTLLFELANRFLKHFIGCCPKTGSFAIGPTNGRACGKLKCCLLYELDTYIEARQEFPEQLMYLETAKGLAKPLKTDYLKKEIWFSIAEDISSGAFPLPVKEVKDIIQQNKRGIKPEIKLNVEKATDDLGLARDER
jgi:hypothetical protein